jgi:anthranilate synthase component I
MTPADFHILRAEGHIGQDIRAFLQSADLIRPCFLETRVFDAQEGGKDIYFSDPPLLISSQGGQIRVSALNARGQILAPLFQPQTPDQHPIAYLDGLMARLAQTPFGEFGLTGLLPYDFGQSHRAGTRKPGFHFYFADAVFLIDSGADSYSFKALANAQTQAQVAAIPQHFQTAKRRQPAPLRFGPLETPPQEDSIETLRAGLQRIEKGQLHQLTLSRSYAVPYRGDAFTLYAQYARNNPTSHNYYLDFGDFGLFGASIATQLKQNGERLSTIAIGGTARRNTQDHGRQSADLARLLTAPKERHELDMLVDIARNDLAAISGRNAKVSAYRHLSYHSKVIHTYARITAPAPAAMPVFAALAQSMPAGTVSGYPRAAAMRAIGDLETTARDAYGGAIGFVCFDGSFDMSLAIRGVRFGAGRMEFAVGSSLVACCDPVEEFHEAEQKAAGFLDTLRALVQPDQPAPPPAPLTRRVEILDPQGNGAAMLAALLASLGPVAPEAAPLRLVLSWPETGPETGSEWPTDRQTLVLGEAAYALIAARYRRAFRQVPLDAPFDWQLGATRLRCDIPYRRYLLAPVPGAGSGVAVQELGQTHAEGGVLFGLEPGLFACLIDPLSTGLWVNAQSPAALRAMLDALPPPYPQKQEPVACLASL